MLKTRRELVFFILGGFFLTNALLAELAGGKLFEINFDWGWIKLPIVRLSIGLIPWPVVFITTDLVNEYYGRDGVRKLTFLTTGMILYAFLALFVAMQVPAWDHSAVNDSAFNAVFGQSQWIIAGSIIAFFIAQFLDAFIFTKVKHITGSRFLWLRATGSTAISQLVDTFVINYIAFVLPKDLQRLGVMGPTSRPTWSLEMFFEIASTAYMYKLAIAILITPVIYFVHAIIDRYLEEPEQAPSSA